MNQGLASQSTLDSALVLQRLARTGAISQLEACQMLQAIKSIGADLRSALVSCYGHGEDGASAEAAELLHGAGVVSCVNMEQAAEPADHLRH